MGPQVHARLPSNLLSPILRQLAPRQTLAAPKLTTSSQANSTMTSSTAASLLPSAFPRRALSAMRRLASTARRTAKPTACLAGASLAACPAPCPHRRPSPPARVSPLQPLILVKRATARSRPVAQSRDQLQVAHASLAKKVRNAAQVSVAPT